MVLTAFFLFPPAGACANFMPCRRVDIGHRMPLRETEAIVLRTYRLSEADKIASLFTRQLGRLRAVARGAQRPKSRYGGTLEPLSHVRLWIFERENRDLLHLNSVELLESFFDMQKDYRVQLAANFLAEVAEHLLPEREVNERAFRLLLAVLRALKQSGEVNRPLLYFDYWILRLGGVLPDLVTCSACGRELGKKAAPSGRVQKACCAVSAACRVRTKGFPAQPLPWSEVFARPPSTGGWPRKKPLPDAERPGGFLKPSSKATWNGN